MSIRKSLFVLFSAAVLFTSCKKQQTAQSASGPPPVPVSLARATQETVPFEITVVGTVEASSTVEVKSQVSGQLMQVRFAEGQNVREGDVLFEIDARPYSDALRQAEAAVARDQAQIRQAEAALARDQAQSKNADADAARYAELAKAGVISKSQQEQVSTNADVARESVRAGRAAIESQRASLQANLASVEKAKLDISYCTIHSPLSGRTGNLLVDPGNLVRANDQALVVIHRVSPIFVNFNVPEQHLGAIRRRSSLPVRISVQDTARSVDGRVTVIDNTVDSNTGTIRLKASLSNGDGALWPGQFVNVTLLLDTIQNATLVPAEAVQSGQQGQFVYVVKGDGTVEPRVIKAGRAHGKQMVIETGVNPGDSVVIDGHLRLFPGARITAVDAKL